MASKIRRVAAKFQQDIAAHEERAATQMVRQYSFIYEELSKRVDAVTEEIISLQEQGEVIRPNLIYQRTRYNSLLQQVEEQVLQFSGFAQNLVVAEQGYAIILAQRHSQELVMTALGPIPDGFPALPQNFLKFNPDVVEKLIGRSSNGSPLNRLFSELAPKSVSEVQQSFSSGIAQGLNPRQIARTVQGQLQVPLHRAMTISRTEVLNAYRETNREYYVQNSSVVERWRWQCAFQTRTCAACLAMDGTLFDTKRELGSHPNCRCVLVPVVKSLKDILGLDTPDRRRTPGQNGEEWFAKQPEKVQRRILGRAKLERYKQGELALRDTVGFRVDKEWGENRWERSLKQIDAGDFPEPMFGSDRR